MPLLGDLASEHAETVERRETRQIVQSLYRKEPAGRIARHVVNAVTYGTVQQAIQHATDRAIARHLSAWLADAREMRNGSHS